MKRAFFISMIGALLVVGVILAEDAPGPPASWCAPETPCEPPKDCAPPPTPQASGPAQVIAQRCPYCGESYEMRLQPMRFGDNVFVVAPGGAGHPFVQLTDGGRSWWTCQVEINRALRKRTRGEWGKP